jgi:C-terminal processing protease CtpA/Prc
LNLVLRQAIDKAVVSNKLKGLALDFRYANGQDFAAAASVVDMFVSKEKPLLNVGGKAFKSSPKQDAVNLPVAVLVNRETAGAPEAAAALFRETATGLLLGSQTAGQTASLKDYSLSNGEKIRIASEPVLLGDGSALSAKGVMPDILVSVNAAAERAWFADAFAAIPSSAGTSATNAASASSRLARRPRISEADLVRERREGIPIAELDARAAEPDKPQITDPALARAVDLLKGLAVVRQARP